MIGLLFRRADAHNLPFEDKNLDIVVVECTTVLLDKEKLFGVFRVLKPSGYVGDLEMIWKRSSSKEVVDRVYDVWEVFRMMTLEEWKDFYEKMKMVDAKAVDFSETISNIEKAVMKELSLKGIIKMICILLLRPGLRKAMSEYRKFSENIVII